MKNNFYNIPEDWYKEFNNTFNTYNKTNNTNLTDPKEGFLRGNLFDNLYDPYKNYQYGMLNPSNKKEANHIVVFTTDNEGGKSNNKNIELLIRKLEKYNIMYKYIEVKSSDEISSVFIVIDKKENDDLYEHLQQIDK